jgi:hypothetical protein
MLEGIRGKGEVFYQMFAVQQHVASISISSPVHKEKETNISPEFLERYGMLFIKKTSGVTYEDVVRKIIFSPVVISVVRCVWKMLIILSSVNTLCIVPEW